MNIKSRNWPAAIMQKSYFLQNFSSCSGMFYKFWSTFDKKVQIEEGKGASLTLMLHQAKFQIECMQLKSGNNFIAHLQLLELSSFINLDLQNDCAKSNLICMVNEREQTNILFDFEKFCLQKLLLHPISSFLLCTTQYAIKKLQFAKHKYFISHPSIN